MAGRGASSNAESLGCDKALVIQTCVCVRVCVCV